MADALIVQPSKVLYQNSLQLFQTNKLGFQNVKSVESD